jgi:RNA polymerase sigma factor (sigma-70 family)
MSAAVPGTAAPGGSSDGPSGRASGEEDALARRFEAERPRMRAVALRVLGVEADAEDVVQDAWLRLRHTDAAAIDNLGAWLTTVVGRLSLNVLRTRDRHPVDRFPDPGPDEPAGDGPDPEAEAVAAETVALALDVVLDKLTPAERVSFVLHDVFDVPFDAIADVLGRSVDSTRQLASRGRRRIRSATPRPPDPSDRRQDAVDAFFAAGRRGDLRGLLALLHPDVVLRLDTGSAEAPVQLAGAAAVAGRASSFADPRRLVVPVRLADLPGAVITSEGRRVSLMLFTVEAGRITAIDVLADTGRLDALDLSALTA